MDLKEFLTKLGEARGEAAKKGASEVEVIITTEGDDLPIKDVTFLEGDDEDPAQILIKVGVSY